MKRLPIFAILFGSIFLLFSCDPRTRYRILTTFIDGVPPYEEWLEGKERKEEKKIPEVKARPGLTPVVYVNHKPYAEGKCGDCHDPIMANRTVLPREELCFKCHKGMRPDPEKFTHGPVAAGMCIACHNPHRSENKRLLLIKAPDICISCHGKMDKGRHVHPPVLQGDCGICHDLPHSMGKDFMLNSDTKNLCLGCHGDKVEYKFVHGVVAAGECLKCHRTHKDSPSHLITASQAMCSQCHDVKGLKVKASHKGVGDTFCFQCHNPHGGGNPFFLK